MREALTSPSISRRMNRTRLFGLNKRVNSYFMGSELASSGLPKGKELEILNQYKDQAAAGTVHAGIQAAGLRHAAGTSGRICARRFKLLAEAGWKIKDGKMINEKTGEPFKFEILGNDDRPTRLHRQLLYRTRCSKIGIDATLRIVDTTQYINRVNDFDFDMITACLAQSESPGNEQRDFWSTKAADTPGSRNFSGIKNPVVDALVERVIFATDRDDLVAATHALDRVLLWNYYVVPQFTRRCRSGFAYWNKFGIPEKQPTYIGAGHRIPGGSIRKRKRRWRPNTRAQLMRRRRRVVHRREFLALARRRRSPLLPGRPSPRVPTGTICTACRPSAT